MLDLSHPQRDTYSCESWCWAVMVKAGTKFASPVAGRNLKTPSNSVMLLTFSGGELFFFFFNFSEVLESLGKEERERHHFDGDIPEFRRWPESFHPRRWGPAVGPLAEFLTFCHKNCGCGCAKPAGERLCNYVSLFCDFSWCEWRPQKAASLSGKLFL